MKFTAAQIAEVLGGVIVGDPGAEVFELSKIEEGKRGTLTFLSNPKYTNFIYSTQATITIVNKSFEPEFELSTTLIKVDDAYLAFSNILDFYDQSKNIKNGIEQPCYISETAIYGKDLYLGSFAYLGTGCVIGNNVKIYPNCYIGDNVKIGVKIIEGKKERIQFYEGTIIAKKNSSINTTITVRKILQGIGIERVFLLHSPKVDSITVLNSAKVRRSKLYYLRKLKGKASRLKQTFK